ncbi:MAG TPA: DUF1937 family protein [Dongiaceae bacterium]|nr:DUF1937 family protein [Dongiaceae bacterium]
MPLPTQKTGALYYLASPYSHKDKRIMEYRYMLVAAAAAELYTRGYNLLEPIGAGHPLAIRYDLPQGYEYWKRRDELMIERSDGVIVLMIDGWKESKGVQAEIEHALSIGKFVWYINPAEVGLPLEIIARYVPPLYVELPEEEVTGARRSMARLAMAQPETARVMGEAEFKRRTDSMKTQTEAELQYATGNAGPQAHVIRSYDPKTGEDVIIVNGVESRKPRSFLQGQSYGPGLIDPAGFNDDELTA